MTQYRIVRRTSSFYRSHYVYDIQRRWVLWWVTISSSWLSLETAESHLHDFRNADKLDKRPKVIKEYD
jgi:hypothetical protein